MQRLPENARVATLFAVLTLFFTYPIWTAPHRLLNDTGDVRLNAWIMAWDAHALATPSAKVFDANVFYPHDNALALSENLLGSAVFVAPINWIGQPALAYNLVLLASFFLTGLATFLWVRTATGSRAAGLVAGVVCAYAPSRLDHLPHIQLLAAWWIPLALLAFERYLDSRRRIHAVAAGALAGWQYLASIQVTLLFAPCLALWCWIRLLWRADGPLRADWRRCAIDLTLAGIVAAILVVPVSLPYLAINETHGMERTLADIVPAPVRAVLSPAQVNRATHMKALHESFQTAEANHYPGTIPGVLFLAGGVLALARLRRLVGLARSERARGRRAAREIVIVVAGSVALVGALLMVSGVFLARAAGGVAWLDPWFGMIPHLHPAMLFATGGFIALAARRPRAGRDNVGLLLLALYLAVLAFLLVLGPEISDWGRSYGIGPHALLYRFAVPYRSIRAIGRFGLPMVFFLGVAAAIVGRLLLERLPTGRARHAALALGLAAIVWEYRAAPIPAVAALEHPWVFDRLAQMPADGAVLHLPGIPDNIPAEATNYMLGSTRHWKPLVNGYSGFYYADNEQLLRLEPFSRRFYETLRSDFPVDYLVVHRRRPITDATYERIVAGAGYDPRYLAPVDVREDAAIFRVRSGFDRGRYVYRRFGAATLRNTTGIEYSIRSPDGPATVEVMWGNEVVSTEFVDATWRPHTVPAPSRWSSAQDGSVTVAWRSLPPPSSAVPLAGGAAELLADVLVDAQHRGLIVAVDDRVRASAPPGALVAVLGSSGAVVNEWRRFALEPRRVAELRAYVARQPEGQIVAIAASGAALRSDLNGLWEALALIGSSIGKNETPDRVAVLGVRGGGVGTALEQGSGGRAAVRAGPDTDTVPQLLLRQIRRLSGEESSPSQ